MREGMELLNQLNPFAEAMLKTLNNVLLKPENPDYEYQVVFTGALAGYACHQVVKANKEGFMVVGTTNNKNYYFGSSLNGYLLEKQYSTLGMTNAVLKHLCPDKELPDINAIIRDVVSKIGSDDYKIAGIYEPVELYKAVKECWESIFPIAIKTSCEEPSEWAVLLALTMQKVLYLAIQNTNNAEKLYTVGLESAIYISKMDDDSL